MEETQYNGRVIQSNCHNFLMENKPQEIICKARRKQLFSKKRKTKQEVFKANLRYLRYLDCIGENTRFTSKKFPLLAKVGVSSDHTRLSVSRYQCQSHIIWITKERWSKQATRLNSFKSSNNVLIILPCNISFPYSTLTIVSRLAWMFFLSLSTI